MSLLLCIDSSADICSVVLSKSKQIIAARNSAEQYAHAEILTVFIADILNEASLSIEQIDAIVYSAGPGSYTGLRIGASVCKGLCYAHNIPFISISTLKAMSSAFIKQHYHSNALYIPVIDARRADIYYSIFTASLEPIKQEQAISLTPNSFISYTTNPVYFFGNATQKCKDTIDNTNCYFHVFQHQASDLIDLADEMLQQKEFTDIVYFEPNYLKAWQGKAKKNKKLQL